MNLFPLAYSQAVASNAIPPPPETLVWISRMPPTSINLQTRLLHRTLNAQMADNEDSRGSEAERTDEEKGINKIIRDLGSKHSLGPAFTPKNTTRRPAQRSPTATSLQEKSIQRSKRAKKSGKRKGSAIGIANPRSRPIPTSQPTQYRRQFSLPNSKPHLSLKEKAPEDVLAQDADPPFPAAIELQGLKDKSSDTIHNSDSNTGSEVGSLSSGGSVQDFNSAQLQSASLNQSSSSSRRSSSASRSGTHSREHLHPHRSVNQSSEIAEEIDNGFTSGLEGRASSPNLTPASNPTPRQASVPYKVTYPSKPVSNPKPSIQKSVPTPSSDSEDTDTNPSDTWWSNLRQKNPRPSSTLVSILSDH